MHADVTPSIFQQNIVLHRNSITFWFEADFMKFGVDELKIQASAML